MALPSRLPRIARADNALLFDEDGRRYLDLFSGNGAVALGHNNPEVTAAVVEQAGKVWLTGVLGSAVRDQATALVESFFPTTHRLVALYSTGMEAAEFALRFARAATGKKGVVGFARSMHGKSLGTASLGWENNDGLKLPGCVRLPFVPDCCESKILAHLQDVLAQRATAAVFLEPIQGCGGGHSASAGFYGEVRRLCTAHGALLVFDEILTGFYRTGPAFCYSAMGLVPDLILIGKALANGFPVSGVVAHRDYQVQPRMLPGSTFAGNPLAAAAVAATLRQMRTLDLPTLVARIEYIVTTTLAPLAAVGMKLRGQGALWVLEAPVDVDLEAAVVRIFEGGVCVGHTGRLLRILPPLTIEPHNLRAACALVRDECWRVTDDRN